MPAEALLLALALGFAALSVRNLQGQADIGLAISPYKGLAMRGSTPAARIFGVG